MKLRCLKETAYYALLNNIDNNRNKYDTDKVWLDEYFNGQPYYDESSVTGSSFNFYFASEHLIDKQKSEEDIVNVKIVYSALRNLTPAQAINKYLWTYLCHANQDCYSYIKHRWEIEKNQSSILTRFFVRTPRDVINDNAIARLWWYGYLTYDKENTSNPYHLLNTLLINQTIATDVMDTLNRRNLHRLRGVLKGIKQYLEYKEGNSQYLGDRFRECKKYLNRYAAVTSFDFLSSEEICNLTANYMVSLDNAGWKKQKKK